MMEGRWEGNEGGNRTMGSNGSGQDPLDGDGSWWPGPGCFQFWKELEGD